MSFQLGFGDLLEFGHILWTDLGAGGTGVTSLRAWLGAHLIDLLGVSGGKTQVRRDEPLLN